MYQQQPGLLPYRREPHYGGGPILNSGQYRDVAPYQVSQSSVNSGLWQDGRPYQSSGQTESSAPVQHGSSWSNQKPDQNSYQRQNAGLNQESGSNKRSYWQSQCGGSNQIEGPNKNQRSCQSYRSGQNKNNWQNQKSGSYQHNPPEQNCGQSQISGPNHNWQNQNSGLYQPSWPDNNRGQSNITNQNWQNQNGSPYQRNWLGQSRGQSQTSGPNQHHQGNQFVGSNQHSSSTQNTRPNQPNWPHPPSSSKNVWEPKNHPFTDHGDVPPTHPNTVKQDDQYDHGEDNNDNFDDEDNEDEDDDDNDDDDVLSDTAGESSGQQQKLPGASEDSWQRKPARDLFDTKTISEIVLANSAPEDNFMSFGTFLQQCKLAKLKRTKKRRGNVKPYFEKVFFSTHTTFTKAFVLANGYSDKQIETFSGAIVRLTPQKSKKLFKGVPPLFMDLWTFAKSYPCFWLKLVSTKHDNVEKASAYLQYLTEKGQAVETALNSFCQFVNTPQLHRVIELRNKYYLKNFNCIIGTIKGGQERKKQLDKHKGKTFPPYLLTAKTPIESINPAIILQNIREESMAFLNQNPTYHFWKAIQNSLPPFQKPQKKLKNKLKRK